MYQFPVKVILGFPGMNILRTYNIRVPFTVCTHTSFVGGYTRRTETAMQSASAGLGPIA